MTNTYEKFIADESQMLACGTDLAKASQGTGIFYLQGDLGAGKTTLARGFLRGLGYQGKVKSPTYTLVEPYEIGAQKLYHCDFYRLNNPQELEFIGIQDYLVPDALALIEWPEKVSGLLPPADLSCYIVPNLNGRHIRLEAHSVRGRKILKDFVSVYGE